MKYLGSELFTHYIYCNVLELCVDMGSPRDESW